jgi:hypothetical protein
MFSYLGPLPNLALPAVLGVFGAAAGYWMEKQIRLQIRRRRLMKQGFSPADLTSNERFFKKLGEITVAKIPQRILFSEVASHSWSEPAKYEQSKTAFESLGFRRSSTFVASPQEWVVEFWLGPRPQLWAKIIDSSERGVYSEVSVTNADGCTASFENTEECGLQHREPDRWVHCGLIAPAQLVEIALRERPADNGEPMKLAECVSAYEQSVNEYLAWRRSVGISADEMKRTYELQKKRRSRA